MGMTSTAYSKEQLNYFRICYLATDILPEGLRWIFKQEWGNRYKATALGEWKDTPQNGLDFYNGESPGNQRRNARLLATMINGNRAQWDCTMLFYAILHSDSFHGLHATVRSSVDDLREFRNEDFAHMPQGELSDLKFRVAVRKVEVAFQALGLSTAQIQTISKQKSFPTEELQNVMKKVRDLYQELQEKDAKLQTAEEQRQVLEVQLQQDVSSFCILPPKPSHEVAARDCEVAKITQKLKKLKNLNEDGLSYLYVSGNPGSGKSQLAALVAKKIYDKAIQEPEAPSFVMTLNAESLATLLESYVSLARQVKCPEYTVNDTRNSKEMKIGQKIINLKDLIATKIELFASWLLVVDNVTIVSLIHDFLPQPGSEQWNKGQLLITTQDTLSIPSENSFVSHINISKGMESSDASSFLAKISGIEDQEMEEKVAKALDFQPLALASAGTYLKKIRESKVCSTFGWKEYLEKLERGKRALTEKELTNTNPSYPKSMTAATRLAVERAITSDSVVKNAFTFLSVCSSQPLNLDILINYILNVDRDLDKEEISIQIQGYSLLLFEEREDGGYIRLHQVVHDAINSVIKEQLVGDGQARVVDVAVRTFKQFVDINLPYSWEEEKLIIESKHLIPHLKALVVEIKNVIDSNAFNDLHLLACFQHLGRISWIHSELLSAKGYFEAVLKLISSSHTFDDVYLQLITTIQTDLGNVEFALGELHQAKVHYLCDMGITLKLGLSKPVNVADGYNHLGNVERKTGHLQRAKEHYENALDILLKYCGPEHVQVPFFYSNLAGVEHDLGDLLQSKKHHEHALNIFLKNHGPESVYVANSYNSLGCVERDLGDLQQAKDHYKRALDIQLTKLGPEHIDVLRTLSNFGNVLRDLGDLLQAKELHERVLKIELKRLGPDHVDLASTHSNLAAVQFDLGDLQRAKKGFEIALDIRQKTFGPRHVLIARDCNNLGAVQAALGDLQQAKKQLQRALDIRLEELGPEHVDVASTYHNLGSAQHGLGELLQAKENYERALDIQLKILPPEHFGVAKTIHNLRNLGELLEVKENYEHSLDV